MVRPAARFWWDHLDRHGLESHENNTKQGRNQTEEYAEEKRVTVDPLPSKATSHTEEIWKGLYNQSEVGEDAGIGRRFYGSHELYLQTVPVGLSHTHLESAVPPWV